MGSLACHQTKLQLQLKTAQEEDNTNCRPLLGTHMSTQDCIQLPTIHDHMHCPNQPVCRKKKLHAEVRIAELKVVLLRP